MPDSNTDLYQIFDTWFCYLFVSNIYSLALDVNVNVLTFHNQQQRLNHLSLMSIESELSRKQNF